MEKLLLQPANELMSSNSSSSNSNDDDRGSQTTREQLSKDDSLRPSNKKSKDEAIYKRELRKKKNR